MSDTIAKAYFETIDEAIDYAITQKWTGYKIRREVFKGIKEEYILFSVERDEKNEAHRR